MKDIICIISADGSYSKKFVSQATKLLGKKYLFLAFTSIKALIEYTHDNNVFAVIIEENTIKDFSEVKAKYFYILCEKKGEPRKDGRKTYVYKLQNAKKIFDKLKIKAVGTDGKGSLSITGKNIPINTIINPIIEI